MPRGQAKTYESLDLNELSASKLVTDPNEAQKLAPVSKRGFTAAERTPVMKQFDQWVGELYDAWVAAGKPKEFAKSPLRKVPTAVAKVPTVKFLVTKSVGYVAKQRGYGMSAEFGKADAKLQDGRVMVSFRVTDPRRVSKPKNGTQS